MKRLEKISYLILGLFFILIPLFFISTKTFIFPYRHSVIMFEPAKEALARCLTLLLGSILFIQIIFFKKPVIKTPVYVPMIFFLLLQGLSLLWAHSVSQGIEYFVHWISLFSFFFVCLHIPKDIVAIERLLKIAVNTGAFICLLSFVCYSGNIDLPFFDKRSAFYYAATFGNYKFTAEFLSPLTFLAFGLSTSTHNRLEKKYYFSIGTLFVFSFFYMYRSRAALIGLVFPTIIYLVLKMNRKKYLTYLLNASWKLKIIGGVFLFTAGFLILKTDSIPLQRASNSQRMIIWKNTLKMIWDHPWRGVGIGNFNIHFWAYTSPQDRYSLPFQHGSYNFVRQTHNEYLQLWSELGIFGILLFMMLIWGIIKMSIDTLKTQKNSEKITMALWLSLLSNLAIGGFVFNFQNAASSYFWIAFMAFLGKLTLPFQKTYILNIKALKLVSVPILLVIFLYLPNILIRQACATYYQLKGQSFLDIHSMKTISILQKALQWNPHDWEILFLISKAYEEQYLYPEAINYLKKSLDLNPFHESSWFNLGFYYQQNKNIEAAIQTFKHLLTIAPDYRKALVLLGRIALSQHKCEEAGIYFKKALAPAAYYQSEKALAFLGLAICDIRNGKTQKAVSKIFEAYLIDRRALITDNPVLYQFWHKHRLQ